MPAPYRAPAHPYTRGSARLDPAPRRQGHQLATIKGLPPNLMRPPSGCPFHPRCPYVQDICRDVVPPLVELGDGRTSACHFAEEVLHGRIG